jgi:GT2 family glycosyltransferase
MMRATALEAVGGYRNELIAGEEPELSIRLREKGWRLWRIDESMAIHDADMSRFSQWWRRSVRSGYAYALGASLHGQPPGRHFVWEGRRALLWGLYIPVAILTLFLLLGLPALGLFAIYPLQLLRQTLRSHGRFQDRFVLASFQLLSKFPEAIGQLKFRWHRIRQTPPAIIEHKASAQS